MITYKDNVLRFTFPDVAREIRARFERELQAILPALSQPDQREGLLQELDSRRESQQLDEIEYTCLRGAAQSLSVDDIEAAVRIAVPNGVATGGPPLAELRIEFQRTLRIPDDGGTYPLPAGTGRFPLLPVDDFARTAPESWIKHGGVMMPMYQSEALWIRFTSRYPFAVKVAAGKINAVSGEAWSNRLEGSRDGNNLGNSGRVRIFPVECIKGLEFEAVFYVGFDRMADIHKELIDKYVYVGLSRARSFRGVAYERQFPQRFHCIEQHFVSRVTFRESP